MKRPRVRSQQLRTAAAWHQSIMEISRVASIAATREDALASLRKCPVVTIEDAERELLTTATAAEIRHFSSFCEAYSRKHQSSPFTHKPIPSPFEWQLMEDISAAIFDAAKKGTKLSDREAVQEMKHCHRARYKGLSDGALRQQLMRARAKQRLWEAYAIRYWSAARQALTE